MKRIPILCALALFVQGTSAVEVDTDVFGVTLPPNIAPLNVGVREVPKDATVRLVYRADDGAELVATGTELCFPEKPWRDFLAAHTGEGVAVRLEVDGETLVTATNRISRYPIDSYLTYRLIPPGYQGFRRLGIFQRNLETFDVRSLYRNDQGPRRQCVNCHTYNQAQPDTWMFHVRSVDTGTVVMHPKYGLRKVAIPSEGVYGSVTYPAWHPSGESLAFSVNEARQQFYAANPAKVEVADMSSDLILYTLADGAVTPIETGALRNECYPTWSPDGRTLYSTCLRTGRETLPTDVAERERTLLGACTTNFCYDLDRRTFDPTTRRFSAPETLLDGAENHVSVTLPRVSPDGRWLVFACAPYGMFHIWHAASDLWIVDLTTGWARPAEEVNSAAAESYHSFSSDGRWMVFSSRREDGVYTRPYLAAFDPETGRFGKPFRLPFKSPRESVQTMFSFNVPEFSTGPVRASTREIRRAVEGR